MHTYGEQTNNMTWAEMAKTNECTWRKNNKSKQYSPRWELHQVCRKVEFVTSYSTSHRCSQLVIFTNQSIGLCASAVEVKKENLHYKLEGHTESADLCQGRFFYDMKI